LREDLGRGNPRIVDVGCHVKYWVSSGDGQTGEQRDLQYAYKITYNTSGTPVENENVNRWWGSLYGYDVPPDWSWLPTRQTSVDTDWWGSELDYNSLATLIPLN
jgi:hypothetical protein